MRATRSFRVSDRNRSISSSGMRGYVSAGAAKLQPFVERSPSRAPFPSLSWTPTRFDTPHAPSRALRHSALARRSFNLSLKDHRSRAPVASLSWTPTRFDTPHAPSRALRHSALARRNFNLSFRVASCERSSPLPAGADAGHQLRAGAAKLQPFVEGSPGSPRTSRCRARFGTPRCRGRFGTPLRRMWFETRRSGGALAGAVRYSSPSCARPATHEHVQRSDFVGPARGPRGTPSRCPALAAIIHGPCVP